MGHADELRAAAARIRELAEAATPGPWRIGRTSTLYMNGQEVFRLRTMGVPGIKATVTCQPGDAEQFRRWDPPTAEIVAELLEAIANLPKPSHIDVLQISHLGQVLAQAINSAEVQHDS